MKRKSRGKKNIFTGRRLIKKIEGLEADENKFIV